MSAHKDTAAPGALYTGHYCNLLSLNLDHAPLYEQWLGTERFQAYHPLLKRACPTLQAIKLHILRVQVDPAKTREVVIWHRAAGMPIGLISLSAIDEVNGKAELSMVVMRMAGSRCMWEAVHACIALCFERLQLFKLVFHVNPQNTALCELLRRSGFTQEGLLQQEIEVEPGKRMDLRRFALFRATYRDTHLLQALQRLVPIAL